MQVQFKQWLCDLSIGRYANGRMGFDLFDAQEGDPVAKCTINLPDHDLAQDEVAIKNYSENEGMLESLQQAGVVGPVLRSVQSGFVTIPICRLLIPTN